MTQKRSYKQYPKEFKDEAVALVLEQGYSVPKNPHNRFQITMKIPFLLLFLLLSQPCFADKNEPPKPFEPVTLKNSKMALQSLIKFPKEVLKSNEDKSVVIRCDAFIERTGKFSSNFCYEEGEILYPYVTAINRAARSAVVNPGRVNGTGRNVYFQYYVVFMNKGAKTSIEVFANSGLEVEKYGLDYSSPQRFKEGSGNFGSTCGLGAKVTVNAVISELGDVKSVEVVGGDAESRCAQYLKKIFFEQKYIPALVNGKAVHAFYSEKIFNTMRQQ